MHVWSEELHEDPDRVFIINGIAHGFRIIDDDKDLQATSEVFVNNNWSALAEHDRVETQIQMELDHGRYVSVSTKPRIVSALSAVPKSDNTVRLIHDLSRPDGLSVNSMATKDPFQCESVADALSCVQPGWFMAKVDLQSAYRCVPLHPSQFDITGLHWTFRDNETPQYMYDSRLPFGARKSPAIFHRITQSVKRMMIRRGFKATVVYLDDFFVAGKDLHECLLAYNTLISLLRSLGLMINWKKVCDPCQRLTFLGVVIDTAAGVVALEEERVQQLQQQLDNCRERTRMSRRQLESLAGRLSWASHVIPWGRSHLRPLFDTISKLKRPQHKAKVHPLLQDLLWWKRWLTLGNNTRLIWDTRPTVHVSTDASDRAGGAFCHGDWLFAEWASDWPEVSREHINVKELASVYVSALRWSNSWTGKRILVHTDSKVVEAILNKGYSRGPYSSCILKALSTLALLHNFAISAVHIPGNENVIPDALSRLHSSGQLNRFLTLLYNVYATYGMTPPVFMFCKHMSRGSFLSILPQMRPLAN